MTLWRVLLAGDGVRSGRPAKLQGDVWVSSPEQAAAEEVTLCRRGRVRTA